MAPHAESPPHGQLATAAQTPLAAQREPSPAVRRAGPRTQRSEAELAFIRVKNRRREYLERNPAYFQSAEHEFADPLLYDELVRRFQTPAEREADGKAKGYGRVLEGSLLRGEARLAALAAGNGADASGTGESSSGRDSSSSAAQGQATEPPPRRWLREEVALEADIAALSTPPTGREDAADRWQEFLRARFVRGGDEDFDYAAVDEDEELDALARRDEEEAWFEDEDPDWASTGGEDGQEGDNKGGESAERVLRAQTGVQDF